MKKITKIRITLGAFIVLLILSGITAFPIKTEIDFMYQNQKVFPNLLEQWIGELYQLISDTPPLFFYGTDWLAFAHIIIALFFIPIYKNPTQYQLNLTIGMIACLAIFPLAFVCGAIRGIPFFHQLIDCSFGIIGFLVLLFINRQINLLKYEK